MKKSLKKITDKFRKLTIPQMVVIGVAAGSLDIFLAGSQGWMGSWGEKQIYTARLLSGEKVVVNEIDNRFGLNSYRMFLDGKNLGDEYCFYDTKKAPGPVIIEALPFYDPQFGPLDISIQKGFFYDTFVLSEERKAEWERSRR